MLIMRPRPFVCIMGSTNSTSHPCRFTGLVHSDPDAVEGRSTLQRFTNWGETVVEKILLSMKDMENAVLCQSEDAAQLQLNCLPRKILKNLS